MKYVLMRINQGGGYVSNCAGRTGSTYTRKVAHIRLFATKEEAIANSCPESEIAVPVNQVIGNAGIYA